MRVYKFLDARWGEEALRRRRLKVSYVLDLNDPFEGNCVLFSDVDEQWAWSQTREHVSAILGLVSFSKGWDNPVLWSHYADSHKGIVLGFDIDDTEYLRIVEYVEVFLNGVGISNWNDPERLKLFKSAYSTKHKDWAYETEVRQFIKLTDQDPYSKLYFVDFFPDLQLREIIFGTRFTGDIPYIKACLSDVSDLHFVSAGTSIDSFSIVGVG